jgi:hypothetical protein
MPKFECHYCTQHIDAANSLCGQNVACPTCGTILTVPLHQNVEQRATPIEIPPTASRELLGKARTFAGSAAIAALVISALCVVIPYASAGERGMALLTSPILIGESLGRWFAAVAVAAVISAAVAGAAHLLNKPFALMFFRAFAWMLLVASAPQLVPSIKRGASIAALVKEREDKARSTKHSYSASIAILENAARDVSSAAQSGTPNAATPSASDKRATPVAEFEMVSRIIGAFAQDITRARKDYEEALEQAGIEKLLNADRMAKDANFTGTLAILMQARSAAQQSREQFETLMENFPQRLDSLELSESTKRNFLVGFQESLETSMPQMRESLNLEDKVVDLFEKVVDHLIATKGRWKPSNGMFMFYEDADLEVFNDLLQQIVECAQRQQEIQKAAEDTTTQKIESLKEMLRD